MPPKFYEKPCDCGLDDCHECTMRQARAYIEEGKKHYQSANHILEEAKRLIHPSPLTDKPSISEMDRIHLHGLGVIW